MKEKTAEVFSVCWRLGLVLVLGAYWAGSRWGERQPQSVGAVPAVPASFPEPKPGELLGDEAIYVKIYSQAAPAVANIVTRTSNMTSSWNRCRWKARAQDSSSIRAAIS